MGYRHETKAPTWRPEGAHLALAATVQQFDGAWIESFCQCGNRGNHSVTAFVRQNPAFRIRDLVARLRCSRCRQYPVEVRLNERMKRIMACGGNELGWSVILHPLP